jgi:heat shock protein HtpX
MFANSTKVWIFIISVCLFFLLVGYRVGDRAGLLLGLILAVILNVLIFFYGEAHILSLLPVRISEGQDPWGLGLLVEDYAYRLGLRRLPKIYVLESQATVAFCVSIAWRTPCICISEGLLKRFSSEDLRVVMAHQIGHVRRMDTFGFGVTSILANTFVGVGQLLDQWWPLNFFLDKKQKPFLTLLSPLGWIIIRSVVRTRTYFENDALAAELVGDRRRLGEILWRMEGLAQTQPLLIPPCTSHLFMVNPEGFEQKNLFLKSHPSMESRLLKLLGYYPI